MSHHPKVTKQTDLPSGYPYVWWVACCGKQVAEYRNWIDAMKAAIRLSGCA